MTKTVFRFPTSRTPTIFAPLPAPTCLSQPGAEVGVTDEVWVMLERHFHVYKFEQSGLYLALHKKTWHGIWKTNTY